MNKSHGKPQFKAYPKDRILPVPLDRASGKVRWGEVIARESKTAAKLIEAAWKLYPSTVQLLEPVFAEAYREFDGAYIGELEVWAKALGIPFGQLALVNCAYEVDHVGDTLSIGEIGEMLFKRLFACSAGVVELEGGEPVHLRNLDWPISGMGDATRVFEFTKAKRRFVTVGFPGFVGALSGMLPGAYSVSINWAPPNRTPSFDHSPSLLLRQTLESCDTYEKALTHLRRTKLSTSVFYTLCGTAKGEGCVIERTPDKESVRELSDGYVAVTNHYRENGAFKAHNEKLAQLKNEDFLVQNTFDRLKDLTNSVKRVIGTPWSAEKLFGALDGGRDVTNYETCQRILFRPRTGDWEVQTSC